MMINHPFRFFILNCFILISWFISPVIYADIDSSILAKLKKDNVVDTTQTLSIAEIQNLQSQNEQLYRQSNVDFKILMISSTNGESIEQYALDVFNTLKIGDEKLDNGLLLVVAKDDRKMRFEVGYGLEGDITDIEAGRIIQHTLVPYFKNNNYYSGLYDTQHILLSKKIKINPIQPIDHNVSVIFKILGGICLSFLLCIPLYWILTKAILHFGFDGAFGVFAALLVLEIFIHLFVFGYLFGSTLAFFICAFIPVYAPFMLNVFLPFNAEYRLVKIVLYSLPIQIFSLFAFGIFYYIGFYPEASLLIFLCISLCLILVLFRYLLLLYRFKQGTENAYLSSFYQGYLKEKARKKMINARYDRLNLSKNNNKPKSYDNSSSRSSSWSSSSSSSSSSSDSSQSSSSSDHRDSGGSSGGGGASGSW